MKTFDIFKSGAAAGILCDSEVPDGVGRVAGIMAQDIHLVTGVKPVVCNRPEDCTTENVIIVTTLGSSSWIDPLSEKNRIEVSCIAGKRECYIIRVIDTPFEKIPQIKKALLIIGSDKRGTIYGMFRLSELCGISPLVFWGDAQPCKKNSVVLEFEKDIITKEPSVKYRGFFINDEWPAFGKWCTEHYGDVNAKAYDIIFQLLLRLKGNYMWPAMWNSSFSEDGPGLDNARLADEYGVIMGASHHEPMCRAGVEWQRQYTKYGSDNAWDFNTNSAAITEFWKDGIIRNKDFENIITIGMRGESDSLLMGEDASIQDNIDVLKRAITVQNRLLKEHINPDLKKIPRMFAIYKEVEDFYYGIAGCDGLQGWEELEDVILLFSEDNHGSLRAIPGSDEPMHSGGYGMYYHFDYHGSPYSYEWLNHINPVRAWEQMTTAYEHGIREMWIVNAGDIKGNEYPLSYFMDLAYDYDKWGITNLNSAAEYTDKWINMQFGQTAGENIKKQIHSILDSYTKWSAARIPESMNPEVYKNNFGEAEKVKETFKEIMEQTEAVRGNVPGECLNAYDSMVYYPVMAFFSAMLVNLTASLNLVHAKRGTLIANEYAALLKEDIGRDKYYIDKFHRFSDGKWNHMMESAHMCFKTWDDNDWAYPVVQTVMPIPYPKIVVSFRGFETYNLGHHWQDSDPICDSQMTRPDVNEIIIDIDSRGDIDFDYKISCDKPWLSFSQTEGTCKLKKEPRVSVKVICDKSKLTNIDTARIQIDFLFVNEVEKQAFLDIKAGNADCPQYPGAFLESQDYICINAKNYIDKSDVNGAGWCVIPGLGREGDAIKCFPVTKSRADEEIRPYVRFEFIINSNRSENSAAGDAGSEYIITFYLSPRNPAVKGAAIKGCYSVNDADPVLFDIVPPGFTAFHTDEEWNYGATNNIRKVSVSAVLKHGLNSLTFYAADPNVLLENIVIYPKDKPLFETHLAPPESYRIPDRAGKSCR